MTLSLRALNRATLTRQLLLTRSPMSALDAIELKHLVSCVSPKGILIIDDYGHWRGASKAVDERLAEFERPVFLSPVSTTPDGSLYFRKATTDPRPADFRASA